MTPTPIPPSFYELATYKTGDFVQRGNAVVGYCYDVFSGESKIMWFGNPDVAPDDYARAGDQLRKARVTVSKRESFDAKRKIRNNTSG